MYFSFINFAGFLLALFYHKIEFLSILSIINCGYEIGSIKSHWNELKIVMWATRHNVCSFDDNSARNTRYYYILNF